MENGVLFYCSGYWVIKDLSFFFFKLLPHQNKPDHSGVRHTVYIIRTLKVPSGR